VEAKAFWYCTGVIFHRDARNSLESSVPPDMMKSDEAECIGRKLVGVDEVEGSCALIKFVSPNVIIWQQKLSHILVRILIRSIDVRSARH
jgi:hypothetical protein